MIQFRDQRTRDVVQRRRLRHIPDDVAKRAARQLDILSAATTLQEARFAGHGRIAKKQGTGSARFYIHVHSRWWISFYWDLKARDVVLEKR
jgi:plasmid maintenance system killer protein